MTRIPQLIRMRGGEPVTYTAELAEYRNRLRKKLSEEVAEFLEAGTRTAGPDREAAPTRTVRRCGRGCRRLVRRPPTAVNLARE